jgi:hypothetical protein
VTDAQREAAAVVAGFDMNTASRGRATYSGGVLIVADSNSCGDVDKDRVTACKRRRVVIGREARGECR